MWWSIPLVFVGQEIIRSEGLSRWRLSYGAYGYSQAGNLWIAQLASIGGVYFLSFLLVAANCALAYALVRRRLASCLPTFFMVGLIVSLGILSQPPRHAAGTEIPVACVQAETQDDREYVERTRQAAASPEHPVIIVLPEHAIEGYADRPHPFVDKLAAIAREYKAYICVGAHFRAPADLPCDYDNVALLLGPDGGKIGAQAKSVSLPFAYDGNPARSHRVFQTRLGCIGMCVCYDADFTDVPQRAVDQGAELLLVPVMNPERWPVQQRLQQAQMARFRSIELRRCAVRAASSGISQIVEPSGHVRAERAQAAGPGILTGKVFFSTERTLFVRGGHHFATVLGISFVAAVFALTLAPWLAFLSRNRGQHGPESSGSRGPRRTSRTTDNLG
jgi:apolipoprotein N-acyltransferase